MGFVDLKCPHMRFGYITIFVHEVLVFYFQTDRKPIRSNCPNLNRPKNCNPILKVSLCQARLHFLCPHMRFGNLSHLCWYLCFGCIKLHQIVLQIVMHCIHMCQYKKISLKCHFNGQLVNVPTWDFLGLKYLHCCKAIFRSIARNS